MLRLQGTPKSQTSAPRSPRGSAAKPWRGVAVTVFKSSGGPTERACVTHRPLLGIRRARTETAVRRGHAFCTVAAWSRREASDPVIGSRARGTPKNSGTRRGWAQLQR